MGFFLVSPFRLFPVLSGSLKAGAEFVPLLFTDIETCRFGASLSPVWRAGHSRTCEARGNHVIRRRLVPNLRDLHFHPDLGRAIHNATMIPNTK
jgi:hypothetical protein